MTELPVLLAARTAYGARGLHAILAEIKLILGLAATINQAKFLVVVMKHVCHGSNNVKKRIISNSGANGNDWPSIASLVEVIVPDGRCGINLIDTGRRRTRARVEHRL
jgi:hypothetical protein